MTAKLIRSARLNLFYGIALILTALAAFFGELLSTINYYNNLPDAGLEGLGVLVVIIYGGIFGIALLTFAIYNIISAKVCLHTASPGKAKTLTVISMITKVLSVAILLFYAYLMIDLYPDGIILKALYIIMALWGLITVFTDISASKSTNNI